MRLLKLNAITGALLTASLFLVSCEKENKTPGDPRVVNNFNIAMTRSVNVPTTVTSTGRIEATLDKKNHLMNYTVYWYGLSSNPVAMHIHGLAGEGLIALPPPLGPYANGIAQTITGFKVATTGSLTGSLYVDGVAIKESDLINGQYYLDIHTVNYSAATYPAGEIRGQISFAR